MLTEESFKNFKTRRLKNICKAICGFDCRYEFFDDKSSSGYWFNSDSGLTYVIFQSTLSTSRKRYVDILKTISEFTKNKNRWDSFRYNKIPTFDSVEELCIKINLLGYDF